MTTEQVTTGPILVAEDLETGYGSIPVLNGINMHVNQGEIVALLGANGAGKTTTLLSFSGDLKVLSGRVKWKGQTVTSGPHTRSRSGMAFLAEERSIFSSLTTRENLRLGRGGVDGALAIMPELEKLLSRRAGLLSGGEQQMLALARALASKPDILLADEISLGLAPLIVKRLLLAIRAAADTGVGILLVEQHVRNALSVADRGYVLRRGRVVMEGSGEELRNRVHEITANYLSDGALDDAVDAPAT